MAQGQIIGAPAATASEGVEMAEVDRHKDNANNANEEPASKATAAAAKQSVLSAQSA